MRLVFQPLRFWYFPPHFTKFYLIFYIKLMLFIIWDLVNYFFVPPTTKYAHYWCMYKHYTVHCTVHIIQIVYIQYYTMYISREVWQGSLKKVKKPALCIIVGPGWGTHANIFTIYIYAIGWGDFKHFHHILYIYICNRVGWFHTFSPYTYMQ